MKIFEMFRKTHLKNQISIFAFDIFEDKLVTASANGDVDLYNDNGVIYKSIKKHASAVLCVRFNRDGTKIASCSDDSTVIIYDKELEVLSFHKNHAGDVTNVHWSTKYFISVGHDGYVVFYDSEATRQVKKIKAHNGRIKGVASSEKNDLICTQGEDGIVLYKDMEIVKKIPISEGIVLESFFSRMSWSPDGLFVACGLCFNSKINSVEIYDCNLENRFSLIGHVAPCEVTAFNPKIFALSTPYFIIAVASQDLSVSFWTSFSPYPFLLLKNVTELPILDLKWNKEGTSLYCCSYDGVVKKIEFDADELGSLSIKELDTKQAELFLTLDNAKLYDEKIAHLLNDTNMRNAKYKRPINMPKQHRVMGIMNEQSDLHNKANMCKQQILEFPNVVNNKSFADKIYKFKLKKNLQFPQHKNVRINMKQDQLTFFVKEPFPCRPDIQNNNNIPENTGFCLNTVPINEKQTIIDSKLQTNKILETSLVHLKDVNRQKLVEENDAKCIIQADNKKDEQVNLLSPQKSKINKIQENNLNSQSNIDQQFANPTNIADNPEIKKRRVVKPILLEEYEEKPENKQIPLSSQTHVIKLMDGIVDEYTKNIGIYKIEYNQKAQKVVVRRSNIFYYEIEGDIKLVCASKKYLCVYTTHLEIYDLQTGVLNNPFIYTNRLIFLQVNNNSVMFLEEDGQIGIYNAVKNNLLKTRIPKSETINKIKFDKKGNIICKYDKETYLYNKATNVWYLYNQNWNDITTKDTNIDNLKDETLKKLENLFLVYKMNKKIEKLKKVAKKMIKILLRSNLTDQLENIFKRIFRELLNCGLKSFVLKCLKKMSKNFNLQFLIVDIIQLL